MNISCTTYQWIHASQHPKQGLLEYLKLTNIIPEIWNMIGGLLRMRIPALHADGCVPKPKVCFLGKYHLLRKQRLAVSIFQKKFWSSERDVKRDTNPLGWGYGIRLRSTEGEGSSARLWSTRIKKFQTSWSSRYNLFLSDHCKALQCD